MTKGLPVSGAGWAGRDTGSRVRNNSRNLYFMDGLRGNDCRTGERKGNLSIGTSRKLSSTSACVHHARSLVVASSALKEQFARGTLETVAGEVDLDQENGHNLTQ